MGWFDWVVMGWFFGSLIGTLVLSAWMEVD